MLDDSLSPEERIEAIRWLCNIICDDAIHERLLESRARKFLRMALNSSLDDGLRAEIMNYLLRVYECSWSVAEKVSVQHTERSLRKFLYLWKDEENSDELRISAMNYLLWWLSYFEFKILAAHVISELLGFMKNKKNDKKLRVFALRKLIRICAESTEVCEKYLEGRVSLEEVREFIRCIFSGARCDDETLELAISLSYSFIIDDNAELSHAIHRIIISPKTDPEYRVTVMNRVYYEKIPDGDTERMIRIFRESKNYAEASRILYSIKKTAESSGKTSLFRIILDTAMGRNISKRMRRGDKEKLRAYAIRLLTTLGSERVKKIITPEDLEELRKIARSGNRYNRDTHALELLELLDEI